MEASTFIWTATCSRLRLRFDEAVKEKKTDASDDRTGSGTGGSTAGCLRSVEK